MICIYQSKWPYQPINNNLGRNISTIQHYIKWLIHCINLMHHIILIYKITYLMFYKINIYLNFLTIRIKLSILWGIMIQWPMPKKSHLERNYWQYLMHNMILRGHSMLEKMQTVEHVKYSNLPIISICKINWNSWLMKFWISPRIEVLWQLISGFWFSCSTILLLLYWVWVHYFIREISLKHMKNYWHYSISLIKARLNKKYSNWSHFWV